jgi:hypothetical protein
LRLKRLMAAFSSPKSIGLTKQSRALNRIALMA